ncbi:prepilin-type N-terminal cleavage/methylation domain-containing protein [Clostridium cibarium]|uniref:Prepilin-type N-terminal cleavage/methylation domain-containing protein n=1 Tax=Clostridium cibarium TaxID=2762247 RepID=A0ABR8PU28_9CLOT|nr:prepilin-type N-terminal cleavage/methylation domain-containing protein [Clostridium cibarium]
MNSKNKCNNGFTLIEVIISVAILAMLIIPLANSIIQSVKISKTSERKQTAAFEGQKILEEFKSYKSFTLSGKELELLNGSKIKQDSKNKGVYNGDFTYTKGKDDYKVTINMEQEKELKNNDESKTPVFIINLPKAGELSTKQDGQDEVSDSFSSDAKNIMAEISNGNQTDYTMRFTYKDNNDIDNLIDEFTNIKDLDSENIIINVGKDYTKELNINIKNSTVDSSGKNSIKLNVITNIDEADDEKARGIINVESILGDVVIRKNGNTTNYEKIGDLYNINVQVQLNGEILFNSSVSQNIEIKKTLSH